METENTQTSMDTIDAQIETLLEQKKQKEEQILSETIYLMFSSMTKEDILIKINSMMEESPLIKMEVQRLLIKEKP